MLALLLCCIQPDTSLFAKLDRLYAAQITELSNEIAILKKSKPGTRIEKLKAELASLQKHYTLTIPIYNFSKGVVEGDIGTIGYYHNARVGQRIPDGAGGYTYVGGNTKTVVQAKVQKIDGNDAYLRLNHDRSSVVVKGLDKKDLAEEKIIPLHKYIYEYVGKDDKTRIKIYRVIGDEKDYEDWKKSKLKK